MDRRKRKTREAIFRACLELIKEKDFQQITINEIVNKADINRGTFYLHFVDKYDMIASYEKEMIDKIEQVIISTFPKEKDNLLFIASRYETIVEILKCFQDNKELYEFIIKSGYYNTFQIELRNRLKVVLNKNFLPILSELDKKIPVDLFLRIFTSLGLSLAEYSYETNKNLNSEEFAKFFLSVIVNGPTRTLGILTEEEIQQFSFEKK